MIFTRNKKKDMNAQLLSQLQNIGYQPIQSEREDNSLPIFMEFNQLPNGSRLVNSIEEIRSLFPSPSSVQHIPVVVVFVSIFNITPDGKLEKRWLTDYVLPGYEHEQEKRIAENRLYVYIPTIDIIYKGRIVK